MERVDEPKAPCTCDQLWLTEGQAARRLNISTKWLQTQRQRGGGPRYGKFGGAVRYLISDLEKFELDSLRLSTSDPRELPRKKRT